MVGFCNEKNHNKEAPNLQNQKCNLRSTWEVISESEDFKKTTPMTTNPPKPTFSLLQIAQRVVCLVLDKSGSMAVCSLSPGLLYAPHKCVWYDLDHNFELVGNKYNPQLKTIAITFPSEMPTGWGFSSVA